MIYIVEVDDKSLPYAGKAVGLGLEARADKFLHLCQVHAYHTFLLIGEHNVSVVAVGLKVGDAVDVYAVKFVAEVKVQILVGLIHGGGIVGSLMPHVIIGGDDT